MATTETITGFGTYGFTPALAARYHYHEYKACHEATVDAWNRSMATSDPATRQTYTELYLYLAASRDRLIIEGCHRAWNRLITLGRLNDGRKEPAVQCLFTVLRRLDPAD